MDNQEEMENNPQENTEEVKREASENTSNKKSGVNFVLWAIVVLVLVGAITLFAVIWNGEEGEGEVLAKVDGEAITKSDIEPTLERMKGQYSAQGIDISEEEGMEDMLLYQAVQNHVQQKLLLDHAKKEELEVEDSDIQDEFDQITGDFENQEQLDAALDQAGMTEDEFKEEIRISLLAQLIAEDEGIDLEVSEEDIEERYEQYQAQMGEEAPPLEEVRDQIETELKNQKVDGILAGLIEELREERDVEMMVEMPQPQQQAPGQAPTEQPQGDPQTEGDSPAEGEEEGMTEEEIMEMMEEEEQQQTEENNE
ncbi:MAG: SurA N-terminal domain-containing protein [Patescibacteria group bacterium]